MSDSLIGNVVEDKYRIESTIGRGGMATVYKATRLQIGDAVAIKVLHSDQLRDAHAKDRFRREAWAAARLKHPNAVIIHDFGETAAGLVYLVMELVEGDSLRVMMKERRLFTAPGALEIVTQVCAALDAAHQQQIVHRDVKPDNIIVAIGSDALRVKVLDFGIARVRDLSAVRALTATGVVVGTPYYMSPEQCLGQEVDHRSDIYSVGVLLYEMLAGVVPFNSPSYGAVFEQHVHSAPTPLRALNVTISPAVEAVVMHALAKRPDERPQKAGALVQELATAVAAGEPALSVLGPGLGNHGVSLPTGPLPPTITMPTPPGNRLPAPDARGISSTSTRRRLGIAIGVAALLLGSAAVGWLANRSDSQSRAMDAALFIQTVPEISVFVDAKLVGFTDSNGVLRLSGLTAGAHVVTLKKDGYEPVDRTVTLEPNRSEVIRAELQATATSIAAASPRTVAPRPADSTAAVVPAGPLPTRGAAPPVAPPPAAPTPTAASIPAAGSADTAAPQTASVASPGPATPRPLDAPSPPNGCGANPRCDDTGPFVAEVTDFATSFPSGVAMIHQIQARVQFRNATNRNIVLGYIADSASGLDDLGRRYTLRTTAPSYESVRGIGLVQRFRIDPQFVLRPGESGNAVFTLSRNRERNDAIGTTFTLDMTVAELIVSGGQARTAREYAIEMKNLNGRR
jgi:serine/threonine protein kinase